MNDAVDRFLFAKLVLNHIGNPRFLFEVSWLGRWALGALIYFMLKGEMPFGSWRESELTFARIIKGQLTLPQDFSNEAVDIITKVRPSMTFPFLLKVHKNMNHNNVLLHYSVT